MKTDELTMAERRSKHLESCTRGAAFGVLLWAVLWGCLDLIHILKEVLR